MKSRLWEGEQRVKSAMTGIAVYKRSIMGRTQKLAAIIKEGVRNPQKIKKD